MPKQLAHFCTVSISRFLIKSSEILARTQSINIEIQRLEQQKQRSPFAFRSCQKKGQPDKAILFYRLFAAKRPPKGCTFKSQ